MRRRRCAAGEGDRIAGGYHSSIGHRMIREHCQDVVVGSDRQLAASPARSRPGSRPGNGLAVVAGLPPMPDDLGQLAELLTTARLGRAHEHHASLSSTNDRALAWLAEGAPDGALVTADHQSAGRGRLGRVWSSPVGRDLYASLILRPGVSPRGFGALALAVGVGLREGLLAAFGGAEAWRERGWP